MIKSITKSLFAFLFAISSAFAGEIANADYVHKYIAAATGVNVPITETNVGVAANVKYLMAAIDAANKLSTGSVETDYANAPLANTAAIDTNAVWAAVANMFNCDADLYKKTGAINTADGTGSVACELDGGEFTVTISGTNYAEMYLSAAGNFLIDWGDGTDATVVQRSAPTLDGVNPQYSHNYATSGQYDITIRGRATEYVIQYENVAAITFGYRSNGNMPASTSEFITAVSGSVGSVFPTIGDGSIDGHQPMFDGLFIRSKIKSLPSELFDGLHGTPSDRMFADVFGDCTELKTVPGDLFPEFTGPISDNMFAGVFADSGLTSIPENLFSGISGAPTINLFNSAFDNTKITSIPAGLFATIRGAPARGMFAYTFSGCTNLTTIPADLFSGISGAPAESMFRNTFNAAGLTSIPAGLFSGIRGAPAPRMYQNTFAYNQELAGSIPAGLFGDISGAPAESMFDTTFYLGGGLTGPIPAGLFGDISGAPAKNMFNNTFSGCTNLTGSIPTGLFGDINGEPAERMFSGTFATCAKLVGEIPAGLFGTFTGSSKISMFYNTFDGCSGLTAIADGIWDLSGLTSQGSTNAFSQMFSGTSNITSPAPTIAAGNPTNLWEKFTTSGIGTKAFQNATKMENWRCIPTTWGGGGDPAAMCSGGEFTVSISGTDRYELSITAAGDFLIDWGDGTEQKVTKTVGCGWCAGDTFSHQYQTVGNYDITVRGRATGYITDTTGDSVAAVLLGNRNYGIGRMRLALTSSSPWWMPQVVGVSGSVGSVFPTIGSGGPGNQPSFKRTLIDTNIKSVPAGFFDGVNGAPVHGMFDSTFMGCVNLESIPTDLFADISGPAAQYMFNGTFSGCASLTSISANLFGDFTSTADYMFNGTFSGCTDLTSIPDGLFDGVVGVPALHMFNSTFSGCTGLRGNVPDDLFGGIRGAPANYMFESTFSGCSGLTSIPEGLFSQITGRPGRYMFNGTFVGCTGLTSIPKNLFGKFTGVPGTGMFRRTFFGCTGLTEIADGIWDLSGVTNMGALFMFNNMFGDAANITSPAPTVAAGNPRNLWEQFSAHDGDEMFIGATNIANWRCIPVTWGGGGETGCE